MIVERNTLFILGAFSRRFSGAKTALSAIMKTLMRFHTASIACASQNRTAVLIFLSETGVARFKFSRIVL
jgi:hypothetical protein